MKCFATSTRTPGLEILLLSLLALEILQQQLKIYASTMPMTVIKLSSTDEASSLTGVFSSSSVKATRSLLRRVGGSNGRSLHYAGSSTTITATATERRDQADNDEQPSQSAKREKVPPTRVDVDEDEELMIFETQAEPEDAETQAEPEDFEPVRTRPRGQIDGLSTPQGEDNGEDEELITFETQAEPEDDPTEPVRARPRGQIDGLSTQEEGEDEEGEDLIVLETQAEPETNDETTTTNSAVRGRREPSPVLKILETTSTYKASRGVPPTRRS